jgi:hypothetical protein
MDESTMNGLDHWTKSMFEKLGWILKAQHSGHDCAVRSFQDAANRLEIALAKKIKSVKDVDRKSDLKILQRDVDTLRKIMAVNEI